MTVIPLYGATQPEMFAIERRAMDRPGKVTEVLAEALPTGRVLDVGAGDEFMAEALQSPQRRAAQSSSRTMPGATSSAGWPIATSPPTGPSGQTAALTNASSTLGSASNRSHRRGRFSICTSVSEAKRRQHCRSGSMLQRSLAPAAAGTAHE